MVSSLVRLGSGIRASSRKEATCSTIATRSAHRRGPVREGLAREEVSLSGNAEAVERLLDAFPVSWEGAEKLRP
ncbi:hypothetical protein GCM10009609_30810 [Pseudonocardia aurantiaca]